MSQPSKGRNVVWTEGMERDLVYFSMNFSARATTVLMNHLYGTNLTRNAILGKLYRVKQKEQK
jgi:hypothetical protein